MKHRLLIIITASLFWAHNSSYTAESGALYETDKKQTRRGYDDARHWLLITSCLIKYPDTVLHIECDAREKIKPQLKGTIAKLYELLNMKDKKDCPEIALFALTTKPHILKYTDRTIGEKIWKLRKRLTTAQKAPSSHQTELSSKRMRKTEQEIYNLELQICRQATLNLVQALEAYAGAISLTVSDHHK